MSGVANTKSADDAKKEIEEQKLQLEKDKD
jgi:hypothetical protein